MGPFSRVKETGLLQGSGVDGLRVAVVDDERLARSRMRRLLSAVGGGAVNVVLECGTADEFLSHGPGAGLDAAFVDIEMPGGDAFDALRRWPGEPPQIVIVTAHPQHALRAYDARAIDYLTKPVCPDRLRLALDRAHTYRLKSLRGYALGSAGLLSDASLTSRQIEILRLVAEQRSNKEIGRALNLSHFTVRNHLSALYRLFGVEGRRALMHRVTRASAPANPMEAARIEGGLAREPRTP